MLSCAAWGEKTVLCKKTFFMQGASLVAIGQRLIVMVGVEAGNAPIYSSEEYHYENRSWTVLSTTLQSFRLSYAAISVPAILFRNMPGGCLGVS